MKHYSDHGQFYDLFCHLTEEQSDFTAVPKYFLSSSSSDNSRFCRLDLFLIV